jgi:hypothetical protein
MKLTENQIETIIRLKTHDNLYYFRSYDSNPNYTDFIERTFGEDYNELHDEWQRCYDFEFDMDWYVYQITGEISEEMNHWIQEGLEIKKEILLVESEF